MDLIDKPAVGEPQHGNRILCPGSLFYQAINELFILFSQLRRDAVPQHADAGDDLVGACLEKSCS